MAKDSPNATRSRSDDTVSRHQPGTTASEAIFISIPLPRHPIPPAIFARLFSELKETCDRNRSNLLICGLSFGSLLLLAEGASVAIPDVDAFVDDLRGIVKRFTESDPPRAGNSA